LVENPKLTDELEAAVREIHRNGGKPAPVIKADKKAATTEEVA
jgi:hypothetical protein